MARHRFSGQEAYNNFGNVFRNSLYKSAPLQKTASIQERARVTDQVTAEATAVNLGHPEYINLQAGETRTANAVVGFVDIRGVTKLSFALESEELLTVIQALTEASIRAIQDGGGYIGEFTGDGVMAYFGDSSISDYEATLAGLETISFLFKSVEEIVNPELKQKGLDPIRIAAGLEFGEVLWSRIGIANVSQLKPIGTATFLAGKLSQSPTRSWECKVGAELARWIPDEYKTKTEKYGPVIVNGEQFQRDLYFFDWKSFASDTLLQQNLVEDRMLKKFGAPIAGITSATRVVAPPTSGPSAPRPLKDQPFFSE